MPHPGYLILAGPAVPPTGPEWLMLDKDQSTDPGLSNEDDKLLLEAYYEKEIREIMAMDFRGPGGDSHRAPMYWSAPFAVSTPLYLEWDGTKDLALVLGVPAAWSGVVDQGNTAPVMFSGNVRANETVPFLIGTPAFGASESAPFAFRGNLVMSHSMPASWRGNVGQSNQAPAAWSVGVLQREFAPYEWDGYGTVRAFYEMPLAPLRQETTRDPIPFTFGGLFQITRSMPVDWTQVVRPELGLPIAWGKELFTGGGVEPMPMFLRLDVAGDELIPVWTLGSVSQDASEQIPIAKHAEIKQVQDLGMMWSGYIDNSEDLPLEFKATLAQLAEIPYDFAVKAVAGEEVPAAILAKLNAVASLPIGKWPEGAILFVEGVDCVWVIKALPPGSETWPTAGCDDGEST